MKDQYTVSAHVWKEIDGLWYGVVNQRSVTVSYTDGAEFTGGDTHTALVKAIRKYVKEKGWGRITWVK